MACLRPVPSVRVLPSALISPCLQRAATRGKALQGGLGAGAGSGAGAGAGRKSQDAIGGEGKER